ncbi:Sulfite reductase [NADPH] flavoprotein alpha-component [Colletotrichum siamense]|uniref:NADPH--hemoprotein reductase n=1 Tax=Colletotrichum siamense TaxID=690259 RepID=A0A9P5EK11_COLSI|nr:Sulfite reductase [NADPH] flavoprotein alpha-component [Colletotrichum siamense]KAF4848076.1 Sulfite reductase [NADPH] flavoprotein alpha-component [Colletotrichum siamense]
MSERSCPVSGSIGGGRCPAGNHGQSASRRVGPRGCSFSGYTQPGDLHAAFDIPRGVDVDEWLRARERKAINEIIYADIPSAETITQVKNVDTLVADDRDLLAVALGAPARQVILRAEGIGHQTGWKDGYLSAEYGFQPPDSNEAAGALANSPGRVWSDLCERMPGCVSRGRVRESVAALPLVEGTEDNIPDQALWAAIVALGMLCSIYRYEDKNDGYDGVSINSISTKPRVEMSDDLGPELVGIPRTIGLPYWQVSRRMGRAIPHLTFFDQASYNIKVRDPTSIYPYIGRFDNTDLRWPMFGERTEIAFLKGCADTSASFQHGPDAIAACQEHVMNRNNEGLLREMIRLKEILERMPNAFHSISTNPNSGDNYVSAAEWVRWGKFSAPLSKRCPAASGLQFPPYLLMDAFLGRKKYDSFLGNEGLHLRAWLPSNLRAFIASVEYHYRIPEYVKQSGDPRLMGVLDGIIEAYTGERGFMGTHRYKVFGILEVASKTGRTETNGASGASDDSGRPWEEVHRQFSDAMKERLEPYRGNIPVEPHEMRGTFEECRYKSRILTRSFVDSDHERSIAMVTLDLHNTGITFQPGDRLAIMPLNSWEECAKVAAALGLDSMLDAPVLLDRKWSRFAEHLDTVSNHGVASPSSQVKKLMVKDILRRGHLAPLTQELVLKIHAMLRASSNTVLQVLATDEWPVRGSLGDLLQAAVMDTPTHIWDQAFDLSNDIPWLSDLIPVEVPRTYSISNYPEELLPSTLDLTISRAEYNLCATFAGKSTITRSGVSSGYLNPAVGSPDDFVSDEDELLVGISRPIAFQLPLDASAPCAFFAGGSGIAPFRSFWQARCGRSVGRNMLFLGVQNREKFCYEDELRQYVNAGFMEVHLAFSRDSRGLAYDPYMRDLVERRTEPRYIDSLIAEQGASVCDLVMSKKQGGLGGYLYICGSVAVFDSVMSGLRKAIYNHRTATMESTDLIINTAFAERRIMLDVFMTPKPLPCNRPTIPLSQLASHTGHRPGGRMWISVHGSVYDVTDFCPMHPGGTLIIKSNAGVDCTKSFDNLAHTNNPEVASLLTKYFVGHLTPKPEYHDAEELSGLYDMWSAYLRTTVETLVSQQFEMDDILGSSKLWFQGSLINMLGVRIFYQYQSRLLQGGFSALFGPKFQELVLKLSFAMANNAASPGADTKLPDILGIIARAKTSSDAVATSKEVSRIGQFICDSEPARFMERGIMDYANKSVQLDIELLEDIREEACHGMDAFDTIMNLDAASDAQRVTALCQFLMQILERMAKRLEVFYSKLAQCSIYQPEIERNPARTRWNLVRRRIRDGSFFVLSQNAVVGAAPGYKPVQETVEFDNVLSQIQQTIRNAPQVAAPLPPTTQTMQLNERHRVRTEAPVNGASAFESHQNSNALNRMSTFIDKNMRAIRRLSKMPPMPLNMSFEQMVAANQPQFPSHGVTTPPSSRGSSRSPTRGRAPGPANALHIQGFPHARAPSRAEESMNRIPLNRRGTHGSDGGRSISSMSSQQHHHHQMMMMHHHGIPTPMATPPLDSNTAIQSMVSRLNLKSRSVAGSQPASPALSLDEKGRMTRLSAGSMHNPRARSTSTLRTFKLVASQEQARIAPTF